MVLLKEMYLNSLIHAKKTQIAMALLYDLDREPSEPKSAN